MCGRFAFWVTRRRLREEFDLAAAPDELPEIPARYNIVPGTDIAAIRRRQESPTRELAMLRWGLIPSWAREKKTGYRMINARAESVMKKPAFRNAFKDRRCLIPASGFYEWQKTGGKKQPWFITLKDTDLFAFAGLWERWKNPEDDSEVIESCTIITTDSNKLVRPLHDRMPVILERPYYERWLSRQDPGEELGALLRPLPPDNMTAWPVPPRVNNPANDSPECLKPVKTLRHKGDIIRYRAAGSYTKLHGPNSLAAGRPKNAC